MDFDWNNFKYRIQQKDFDGAKGMLPADMTIRDLFGYGIVDYICHWTKNNDGCNLLRHVLGATFDVEKCCGYHAIVEKSDRNLEELLNFGHPIEGTFLTIDNTISLLEIAIIVGQTYCARLLIDRGAQLKNVNTNYHFEWAVFFVSSREKTRGGALAILGLLLCRSRSIVSSGNGKDVLRMISRCVWSTRGHE